MHLLLAVFHWEGLGAGRNLLEVKINHTTLGTTTTKLDLTPNLTTSFPGLPYANHSSFLCFSLPTCTMLEEQRIVSIVPRTFLESPHRQQLHSSPKTLSCGGAAEGEVSSIHIPIKTRGHPDNYTF